MMKKSGVGKILLIWKPNDTRPYLNDPWIIISNEWRVLSDEKQIRMLQSGLWLEEHKAPSVLFEAKNIFWGTSDKLRVTRKKLSAISCRRSA